MEKITQSDNGFTLMEVMIALGIFAVFATAFILSQSANINQSANMAEDLILHNLAETKMNEALLDPPKFTNATDNDPDTGNFETEGFTKYKYKIEYSKLELPNLSQLIGKSGEEEDAQDTSIQNVIFEKVKKNMEEMLWQVKVTVTNSDNNYSYELNTWIPNEEAKVDTNFSL